MGPKKPANLAGVGPASSLFFCAQAKRKRVGGGYIGFGPIYNEVDDGIGLKASFRFGFIFKVRGLLH